MSRGSRRDDIPAAGTVEIRLRGRPEDVEETLRDLLGMPGVLRSPDRVYADRNGVTVRRYLTADLREKPQ